MAKGLPWVRVAPDSPYFVTDDGRPWHPIGQNDAITWPELQGLFRRKDLAAVDRHLDWLASHGVTCLRVMMEYAQGENRYLERPVGHFQPNMVRLWDDFIALCERHGLRLLLTPFDTFWMWIRWAKHPYNRANGGPCSARNRLLLCRGTLDAIKNRLTFAVERWGGSGAIFAWDLWNEMHPAQMGDASTSFGPVASELSDHVRLLEMRLYGRAHPQTVSLFGPVLQSHPDVADTIFRHPTLDFASTHLYADGTIDHPRNSVDPALAVGELVREALGHAPADRPYFDSEHGPIHTFKDRKRTLPEVFDDEYFRHIQWAHLASGGAGGGMRWPNRSPHILTPGMRRSQQSLAAFMPLVDWADFRRTNRNHELRVLSPSFRGFACADGRQAVLWFLRVDRLVNRSRMVDPDAPALSVVAELPGMDEGRYSVTAWSTRDARIEAEWEATSRDGLLKLETPPTVTDVALAVRPAT
ncbi:hypothetical protein FHG66_07770 [Rubellimicrobium rubrum]|uniref:Cellulase family glycosylhydrolase n=1 Tax=Rubellimicrobium rubrum TaxID=2585369 RepID=A0A5C4N1P3_9RHOB|nr:hypothetical protein [Rubellimicrobium rubrum]TNC50857.1 hypothetical protein FHG66_07770 [Rubellimicrobium rubrum]